MKSAGIFLLFALMQFGCPVHSSSIDNQTVTFQGLFDEITKGQPEIDVSSPILNRTMYIRNVNIKFQRLIDNDLDIRYFNGGPVVEVKHNVYFYNCTFDVEYYYVLRQMDFKGEFAMWDCKNVKAIFKNCIFRNVVRMYNTDLDFFHFDSCDFRHGFKIQRSPISDYLKFSACKFGLDPKYLGKDKRIDMDDKIFDFENKTDPIDLTIEDCSFMLDKESPDPDKYFVDLSESNFNILKFNRNFVSLPVNFSQSSVNNQFNSYGCNFNKFLLSEAFNFNSLNAKVQWSTIAGKKIAIRHYKTAKIINGDSESDLQDEFVYNTLISCYASYYKGFKEQGNRLSANACYIEWKDIETTYLQHLKNKSYSFNTYFSWLMNVFLKAFCDYGTNPVKAVLWSFWVMVAFSLVYFFFPYQSGLYKEESIFKKFLLYLEHFSSGKKLTTLYLDQYEKRPDDPDEERYKELLAKHKRKLPFYFRFLGLTSLERMDFGTKLERLYLKFIDKMLLQNIKENRVTNFYRKMVYWTTMSITLFYLLTIRSFNSMTLSLNAFSTLGFGEIPVLGIARYLTILEGFVGWFLLSIFSVSLISQIIQ